MLEYHVLGNTDLHEYLDFFCYLYSVYIGAIVDVGYVPIVGIWVTLGLISLVAFCPPHSKKKP